MRMAQGRGTSPDNERNARLHSLSSMAYIGDPCPTNKIGMRILHVSQNSAGLVKLGKEFHLRLVQPDSQRLHRVFEMTRLACANDRRGNAGLMQDPCQGDLGIIEIA